MNELFSCLLGSAFGFRTVANQLTMFLVLLVSACIGSGLADIDRDQVNYGNRYKIRIQSFIHVIDFLQKDGNDTITIWKRDDPEGTEDPRRGMRGNSFTIENVTQRDSGRYILRNSKSRFISVRIVDVVANTQRVSLEEDQEFSFKFELEPKSCNIYFFPKGLYKIEMVRHGRLDSYADLRGCRGFQLLKPCGILNNIIQTACAGRFEIRDHNDDPALIVSVEIEDSDSYTSYLWGAGGAFLFTVFSCCLKHICGKKSCSTKASSEPEESDPAAEPSPHYQEYDHEPVGPGHNGATSPSGAPCPPQPSETETGPLVAALADTPTLPLSSDFEPRFELKGINFNSNTPHSDVYTSDKLNFL
ncbi:uncharacterized protein ACNS7B_012297 isoform 2-T2 [Menidia menidia]